ncbi:MAG TPA: preprotein translocase subunit SecG [Flavisolibacter sp.]|nr:preprotein translocase subunit SecG [Flavisolibacter sp.]
MTILFIILIIIACVVLSLIILVQNPKGGGLTGNIAGFSSQFMGVKQTTDVLEKGTWIFAGIIAVLCIASTLFISGASGIDRTQNLGGGFTNQQQQTAPAQAPVTPAPAQPTQPR